MKKILIRQALFVVRFSRNVIGFRPKVSKKIIRKNNLILCKDYKIN